MTALRVGNNRFDVAWKVSGGGNTPVVAGGWLWTIGGRTLFQVALDSGAIRSRIPLPGSASFAAVAAGYGRLYVPAGTSCWLSGRLSRLRRPSPVAAAFGGGDSPMMELWFNPRKLVPTTWS